jgi:hypothetical protein
MTSLSQSQRTLQMLRQHPRAFLLLAAAVWWALALRAKGAALGTVLAFVMSVIALSLPEMIILRKVLKLRLILTFACVVATGILAANIGLVVTPAGAVLIDSGATFQSARQIAEAARKVTSQPIKWVINTGGQDHRWLGNGYFQAQGAELVAHAAGEADMKNRGNDHLQALKAVDDGTDVSAALKSFDATPFMRLLNAAELMPGNASRTYLELERE